MRRVERSARISAPPAQVFDYLADLENLPEWQSGVVSAERTSAGDLGVGATALVVRDVMGNRVEAPLRITAYEPPNRLAIGTEISGVKAAAQLDLTPSGTDATDLRFAMEIRGSLLTAFMEPMIAGAAGGEIDASLARIGQRFTRR